MSVKETSTSEWESFLGEQIRNLRLQADLDQAGLAARANISLTALKNLESGKGCNTKTLIKTLRALQRTDWLRALAPPITISPLDMAAAGKRAQPRQRVSRPRNKKTTP